MPRIRPVVPRLPDRVGSLTVARGVVRAPEGVVSNDFDRLQSVCSVGPRCLLASAREGKHSAEPTTRSFGEPSPHV